MNAPPCPREKVRIVARLQVAAILAWAYDDEEESERIGAAIETFEAAGIDYAGWVATLVAGCGCTEDTARRIVAEQMRRVVDVVARDEYSVPDVPDVMPDWMCS